ncbi:MAG TPA: toll/interleukin-1 receptor domain-containing protein [Bryobacteraceae bacterium]|nr:toll/interleukin-1 receptor domain-containing protein [Bryobacteraceae bacterium]
MNDQANPPDSPSPTDPEILPVPKERQRRIFISYPHDESASATERIAPLPERIKEYLEQRGHTVWIDFDHLSPGSQWMARIEAGLRQAADDPTSGRFVLLMTPRSVRPEGFCLNEILRAQDLRLRILPVLVIQCDRPLCIYSVQYFEMSDCVPCTERAAQYEIAVRKLARALELDFAESPQFDNEETTLQNRLQYLDYRGHFKLHVPEFVGREWVFSEIDKWLETPGASRVYLLKGSAGTGKSAIAAYLCTRSKQVKAFHACVHDDSVKRDAARCVQSIAYQLSTQFESYRHQLLQVNWDALNNANATALFDELIARCLNNISPDPPGTYLIVIDALDEATVNGVNELAEFISTHFDQYAPSWLRLLITTRPADEVVKTISRFDSFDLDKERVKNENDIRDYAQQELKTDKDGKALPEDLVRNAADAIAARSEGVFLYAHWVCKDIQTGKLQIDQTAGFPNGLKDVYSEFLKRQYPVAADFHNVKPILSVIAAALDPLPADILKQIFPSEDNNALLLDPLRPLFPCVDGSYRAFHKSILDWMCDDSPAVYRLSLTKGHAMLADYCWGNCRERLDGDKPLRNYFETYAFRHGVSHLLETRRFGDAVVLLDYLFRKSGNLPETDRDDIRQMAKALTLALGKKAPSQALEAEEAKQIPPEMLAERISGLYMTEALEAPIRLLFRYHRDVWPGILDKFLSKDDYVIRHAIADVLASEYIDTEQADLLQYIQHLLAPEQPLNYREVGAYALQGVYANDPDLIEAEYLNRLANGDTYPFRSALGDLLLGLSLQDVSGTDYRRLDIIKQIRPDSKFLNPIWDFNRMDVTWLKAIDLFARHTDVTKNPPDKLLAEALESLLSTDALLEHFKQRTSLPPEVKKVLDSYYKIGVSSDLIPDPDAPEIVMRMPGMQQFFEILFAYPLWDITEDAAALLAAVIDEDPESATLISNLFRHKLWRVQYGAAEAAFLTRFRNKNKLFGEAIATFYDHQEPLLRGDIVENLTAWILDSPPSKQVDLLKQFNNELKFWLTDENADAWILDHVYRLFHQLWDGGKGLKPEETPLMQVSVTSLMSGDPVWYTLERQKFLLRIEDRKRQQVESSKDAASASA